MKLLLTIVLAAAAAFGGSALASSRTTTPAAPNVPDHTALRAQLAEARAENARLAQEIERRSSVLVAARAPESGVGDDAIAAALERWHAAHPPEELAAAEAAHAAALRAESGELDIATVPMAELVRELATSGFGDDGHQQLFQQLRDAGRMDEYLAAVEALAAANPDDPELQVALGHAYLQKLFGMTPSQETGVIATKSDQAFDRALEIDDHNWSARFSKAVALANWPAFMGRGPEAIEHFEILIEQQEALPKSPEFAMTYVFLGNVQQASGDRDEALATWRKGLELFPNVAPLREAIELAEGTQRDAKRDAR